MKKGNMIKHLFTGEKGYVVGKRKYSYDAYFISSGAKKLIIGDPRYRRIRY